MMHGPINISLLTTLQLLTALNCAVCSTVCRGSVMDVVSTVKTYKIVTLVTVTVGSQTVTSAAVHGVYIIVLIYFQVG